MSNQRYRLRTSVRFTGLACVSLGFASACGGGGSTPPPTYTIGGSVSGLTGSGLVLQNSGADNLTVAAKSTSFQFMTPVAAGTAYAVAVLAQPSNPAQTCAVSAGSGTAQGTVTNVSIACKTNTFTIGGTVDGLSGAGLVLQDNGGDNLNVSAGSTSFVFHTALTPSSTYSVSVLTQPGTPREICSLAQASGTVSNSNVTSVAIKCYPFGRFLFVANSTGGATSSGDISGFAINADGSLTALSASPYAADTKPSAIVVDSSGQFAYAANAVSADVSVFAIDPAAGNLMRLAQSPSKGVFGNSIAIAPAGQYVFVGGPDGSGGSSLFGFSRTIGTGALAADPSSPYPVSDYPSGIAVDPSGGFLFVTAEEHHAVYSYSISGAAGKTLLTNTVNSPVSTSSQPYGLVVSPLGGASGGYLFTTDAGVGRVGAFSYDAQGNLSELTAAGSPYPSGTQTEGIAIDAAGTCLYVANYGDGTVSSFAVGTNGALTKNQTGNGAVNTGKLTNVTNPGPIDVKVDPAAPYVYVANYLDGSVSVFGTKSCTLTLLHTYPADSGSTSIAID